MVRCHFGITRCFKRRKHTDRQDGKARQLIDTRAYQQHMLLALSKKYSHLNQSVNQMVEQANGEIRGLSKRIEGNG